MEDIKKTFCSRLRRAMEIRGVSQAELALMIGMTTDTVGRCCNGKSVPEIDTLRRIALALEVSADYLLGISDTAPEGSLNLRERFAAALKREMNRTGVSSSCLAYAIGTPIDVIEKWLKGQRLPSPAVVSEIGEAFGVAAGEFYTAGKSQTQALISAG